MSNIDWLLTAEAREATQLVRLKLQQRENILRIVKTLRKKLSPANAALAMEQGQLQLKARVKFSKAEQMLLTKIGYEQATSERLARYKSSCFPEGGTLGDICCGIGGDAIGLSAGRKLIAVDAEPILCRFTQENLRVYNAQNVHIEAVDFHEFSMNGIDWLHADPDRRVAGRTVFPSDFSPPLNSLIAAIGDRVAAIKLAPATKLPHDLCEQCHREWIGENRETKQQLIWFNHPSKKSGTSSTTVISGTDHVEQLTFDNNAQFGRIPIAPKIGSFVFEPHSVVLAGRLNRGLARRFELQRVGDGVAYLTADHPCDSALVSVFLVEQIVPLQIDKISLAVRTNGYGKIEWKKRAIEQETFEQLVKIRAKGERSITAIVTPSQQGPIVIFCQRQLSAGTSGN